MKVVDIKVPEIILSNEDGIINLQIHSYDIYGDDIVIKSPIRETTLKRGWVGTMEVCVPDGHDIMSGKIAEGTETREVYHDILLRSVKIDSAEIGSEIMWQYTFLPN